MDCRQSNVANDGVLEIVSYNSIVYFCASSVVVALVLFLLFNRPDAYAAFYETVYMADGDPGARPKVGLCLSMPFSKENLESLNVPTQLASFLLFALSPFFPKESVIGDQVRNRAMPKSEPHSLSYHFCLALPAAFTQPGNHILTEPCKHFLQELLTELTAQYRRLLGRASRAGIMAAAASRDAPGGGGNGGQMRPLLRLLRTLSPRCQDVIAACQVGRCEN